MSNLSYSALTSNLPAMPVKSRAKDSSQDVSKKQEAAQSLAQFYCFKVAQSMTAGFESNSFAEEMIHTSQLPHILGDVLSESSIGAQLYTLIFDSIHDAGQQTTAKKKAHAYQQHAMTLKQTQNLDVPDEMLDAGRWGC